MGSIGFPHSQIIIWIMFWNIFKSFLIFTLYRCKSIIIEMKLFFKWLNSAIWKVTKFNLSKHLLHVHFENIFWCEPYYTLGHRAKNVNNIQKIYYFFQDSTFLFWHSSYFSYLCTKWYLSNVPQQKTCVIWK